jgi:hypothetical protein
MKQQKTVMILITLVLFGFAADVHALGIGFDETVLPGAVCRAQNSTSAQRITSGGSAVTNNDVTFSAWVNCPIVRNNIRGELNYLKVTGNNPGTSAQERVFTWSSMWSTSGGNVVDSVSAQGHWIFEVHEADIPGAMDDAYSYTFQARLPQGGGAIYRLYYQEEYSD